MKKISKVFLLLALIAFSTSNANALSGYLSDFNSTYGTSATVLNSCMLCHAASGPPSLNPYGDAYKSGGNFDNIASLDSDGDGFTNLAEITARTFPGNASSIPESTACTSYSYTVGDCQPDGTAAVTGSTGIPAGCSGGAVPETTQACTYVPSACTSYSYTLDTCQPDGTAAVTGSTGIPAGCSGGVVPETTQTCTYVPTVPSTDTVRPRITVFSIPKSSTLMTVPISALNAFDKTGVTGYIVKESPVPPKLSDPGWTETPPADFTFTKAGVRHLYAWAKDAAGNVSKKGVAKVRISLPSTFPVPTSQRTFVYGPTSSPVSNVKIHAARPLGLGAFATGGDTMDMEISLNQFSAPVDAWIGLYALSNSSDSGPGKDKGKALKRGKDDDGEDKDYDDEDSDVQTNEIYLKGKLSKFRLPSGPYVPQDLGILQAENRLQALSAEEDGMKPWKTGVTDISGSIVKSIPATAFVPGTYLILLEVTAAGDTDKYYLWMTYFTVE